MTELNLTPAKRNCDGQPSLAPATGSAGRPKTHTTDKSVRDRAVTVKLSMGQIVVENKTCGIIFSFPAACWPDQSAHQRMWVDRLTPWWDMEQPQWSPTSQRLRESCVKAINKLFPTEQLLTSPSQVGGRGKRVICAAALPGNQSETDGVTRQPNVEVSHQRGG